MKDLSLVFLPACLLRVVVLLVLLVVVLLASGYGNMEGKKDDREKGSVFFGFGLIWIFCHYWYFLLLLIASS